MDFSKSLSELTSMSSVFDELYKRLSTGGYFVKQRGRRTIIQMIASRGIAKRIQDENYIHNYNISHDRRQTFHISHYRLPYGFMIAVDVIPELTSTYWMFCLSEEDLYKTRGRHLKDIYEFNAAVHFGKVQYENSQKEKVMKILEVIEQKKKEHKELQDRADELWERIEELEESLPENHEKYLTDDARGTTNSQSPLFKKNS